MNDFLELWNHNSIEDLKRKSPEELIYEIRMLQMQRDWLLSEQDGDKANTKEETCHGTN